MGLRTVCAIAALMVLGVIVKVIASFVFPWLSAPGQLIIIPNAAGKCGRSRFLFGIAVAAVLQCCLYLVYVVLVDCWTVSAMRDYRVGYFILFAASFAVFFPVGSKLMDVRKELGEAERFYRRELDEASHDRANEHERKLSLDAQALAITFSAAVAGCAFFLFFPAVAEDLSVRIFSLWKGFFSS